MIKREWCVKLKSYDIKNRCKLKHWYITLFDIFTISRLLHKICFLTRRSSFHFHFHRFSISHRRNCSFWALDWPVRSKIMGNKHGCYCLPCVKPPQRRKGGGKTSSTNHHSSSHTHQSLAFHCHAVQEEDALDISPDLPHIGDREYFEEGENNSYKQLKTRSMLLRNRHIIWKARDILKGFLACVVRLTYVYLQSTYVLHSTLTEEVQIYVMR